MFIDQVTISVKAGDGGNGAVTFHREKYVPAGGPDGGDGGRGGSIIFRVDEGTNTLLAFRYHRKFEAERGGDGMGDKMHGKSGADVVIGVPPGTLLRNAEDGRILFDMSRDREFVVCRGGRGGWGNRHFATPTRQIPRFAKSGTKGEALELKLELKMLADVGLIGFPNAGKSSILARISKARPKIAGYPFTTLSPNLGVVGNASGGRGFVAADIPGLIEGASDGLGLGHAFLRHIDRCRLLIHVVDLSGADGRDPVSDLDVIDRELASYNAGLAARPQIIAANKADAVPDGEAFARLSKRAAELGRPIVRVSAATGEGLDALIRQTVTILDTLPPIVEYEPEAAPIPEVPESETETTVRNVNGIYHVEGIWLRNFMERINFDDYDQLDFFERVLRKNGVIDLLREKGVREGDTVSIYGFEFEFIY